VLLTPSGSSFLEKMSKAKSESTTIKVTADVMEKGQALPLARAGAPAATKATPAPLSAKPTNATLTPLSAKPTKAAPAQLTAKVISVQEAPMSTRSARHEGVHKMRKLPETSVKREQSFGVISLNDPATPSLMRRTARWAAKRMEEPASVLKLISVGCVIWIGLRTFLPKPTGLLDTDTLTLCPRETVCATTWYSFVLLSISRVGAYFIYPWMMLLFLSKTNNLRTALQQSFLSMYVPFHDLHGLHVLAGYIVSIGSTIHGICHIARFASHDRVHLLWDSDSGRTGIIAMVLTPFIVLPMIKGVLKKKMSWELRKALHYLSVVWGIILCFHAPVMSIVYLMGVPVGLYMLDYLYGSFFRTYKISDSTFARLERGVELTFKHPPGFKTDIGGYVMICVPWLNKQWHPFSVYRHPTSSEHSSLFIYDLGNWTRALHTSVEYLTRRPVWICGPFASPYTTAIDYDKLVLVATGIGITPALAVLASHKHSRRVNLIWLCRDASLVEYFLNHASFPNDAWTFIYYTGKKQLEMPESKLPRSVLICNGRPDLAGVICELVCGIETGAGLPEDFVAESAAFERELRLQAEVRREGSSRRPPAVDRFGHMLLHAWAIEELHERFLQMADEDQTYIHPDELEEFLTTAMRDEFNGEEVDSIIQYFTTKSASKAPSRIVLEPEHPPTGQPSTPEQEWLLENENQRPEEKISVQQLRIFAEQQLKSEMIPPQIPLTSCRPADRKDDKPAAGTTTQKDGKAASKKQGKTRRSSLMMRKERAQFLAGIGGGSVAKGKARLDTWQILYCGGSQPIVDTLDELSDRGARMPPALSLTYRSHPVLRISQLALHSRRRSSTGESIWHGAIVYDPTTWPWFIWHLLTWSSSYMRVAHRSEISATPAFAMYSITQSF